MNYLIDFEFLQDNNLSLEEFSTLINVNNKLPFTKIESVLNKLEEKSLIKVIKNVIVLREKGKILLEQSKVEKNSNSKIKKVNQKSNHQLLEEVDSFITEYRSKWRGLKLGSMGSLNSCKDKMYRWMKENPSYSKEDILKAADIYLNSLDDYKYLQRADYFIFKKEGIEEVSRLSAFIDEESVDNDWLTELK